jgi:hypothetical protein
MGNQIYFKILTCWTCLQLITQKPLIISKIWHGIKMISTSRSTYLQFWSKSDYPSWSYCPFLVMIQTKFGFHWSSTFRGEDFWKSLRRTTDDDDRCQVMAIAHLTLFYTPTCNFEVNLITHLGVIALFSSNL